MASRWVIPPFKGKTSKSNLIDSSDEQNLHNKTDMPEINILEFEETKKIKEKELFIQKILMLEKKLKEIEEENALKIQVCSKEDKKKHQDSLNYKGEEEDKKDYHQKKSKKT